MKRWLGRVHHDLIKHALWRARDVRDSGGPPTAGDRAALRRGLLDVPGPDGEPVTASALFSELRVEIEDPANAAALDGFARAIAAAEAAVLDLERGPAVLAAVLALEAAFSELARRLDPPRGEG